MFDDSYEEFCDKANKAAEVNKGLKFPRYGKNLRFNSVGVYSYGAKIATLDLGEKTIQRLGYWSPTTSKHYNYAGRVLEEHYNFIQKPPAEATIHLEFLSGIVASDIHLIHAQNLSYDDNAEFSGC